MSIPPNKVIKTYRPRPPPPTRSNTATEKLPGTTLSSAGMGPSEGLVFDLNKLADERGARRNRADDGVTSSNADADADAAESGATETAEQASGDEQGGSVAPTQD